MPTDSEELWYHIRPLLEDFATIVEEANPHLTKSLKSSANGSLFLRAYLAFRKSNDGDEVAITIDVKVDNGLLSVESDVCGEGGVILASGPSSIFTLADFKSNTSIAFATWLKEFEHFLQTERNSILKATSQLL